MLWLAAYCHVYLVQIRCCSPCCRSERTASLPFCFRRLPLNTMALVISWQGCIHCTNWSYLIWNSCYWHCWNYWNCQKCFRQVPRWRVGSHVSYYHLPETIPMAFVVWAVLRASSRLLEMWVQKMSQVGIISPLHIRFFGIAIAGLWSRYRLYVLQSMIALCWLVEMLCDLSSC